MNKWTVVGASLVANAYLVNYPNQTVLVNIIVGTSAIWFTIKAILLLCPEDDKDGSHE